MGRISQEANRQYSERIKEYKQAAESIIQREKSILADIEKNSNGAEYKKIALADDRLNLASLYLLMNSIRRGLLDIKDEELLNAARKCCYQSVIYLEEIVSNYIDAPFSEYSDRLESISDLPEEERHRLARKMGFTIQSVEDDLGENSKWRWSFVELEGRSTVVTKNLINLKTLIAGLDPRVPGYESRLEHLRLVKELLQRSADRYRKKYEVNDKRIDDFKHAIAFLSALKRLQTLLGETEQAEVVKKKLDVWKAKMAADEKKLEEQRK